MGKPIIEPDPSKIPDAVGIIEHAAEPFIPAKLRARIYVIAGFVAVAAPAAAAVAGGIVGEVLAITGAAAAAIVGSTALAHVGK